MRRPDQTSCVEWIVACSRQEVTSSAGMPRMMIQELSALLERWYGSESSAIAHAAADAAAALIAAGGFGRLRVSGTRGQLLVESILSVPPLAAQPEHGSAAELGHDIGYGSYRTFAESRPEHVRWMTLPLPARRHEAARPASTSSNDAWA